jgi:GLPGLI family protein
MIGLYLIIVHILSSSLFHYPNPTATDSTTPLQLTCTYRLTFQPDSTDEKSILTEDMLLYIGDRFSQFQSLNRHLLDSIVVDIESKGGVEYWQKTGIHTSSLPKTRFNFKIYKNYPSDKITVLDRIVTEKYRYTEPKNLFNWTITSEKATIAGYNCQKATTEFGGRKYEAWFTSEVPVSEGPYKFSGLPGLIVKVSDTRNHYTFELISLKQPKDPAKIVFPDDRFIPTTKKEFNKGQKDLQDNMAARLGQVVTTNNPEQANRRAKERAKKHNNPIELTD